MIYSKDEALNQPEMPEEWAAKGAAGSRQVAAFLLQKCAALARGKRRPCLLAIDGYLAVNWDSLIGAMHEQALDLNLPVTFLDVSCCLRPADEVTALVQPCLDADQFFGRVYRGKLSDFFAPKKLSQLRERLQCLKRERHFTAVIICYGSGSALPLLARCCDFTAYVDTTRETVTNRLIDKQLRASATPGNGRATRRLWRKLSYVDLGVFNKHKRAVLARADWYLDGNDEQNPKLIPRETYDGVLAAISRGPFRLKPLYIPGVWGGQLLKKLRDLPAEMVNCSFALEIVPQLQSLRVAVDKVNFEIPFSNLLWKEPTNILGRKSVRKFGRYFPISHNYDDTWGGGNLAIQVHPDHRYLKKKFNERVRRDESYYIVRACDGARTYHGLREGADLDRFRRLSLRAEQEQAPFDYERYVNSWPSQPGDLLLIPAGTVHASGANQLVLEIDSDPGWTGQEYTFHIYDYLRKDLDGSLRDIHIDHAFAVLRPHRATKWVGRHLKQRPKLVRNGRRWAEYNLGECRQLYYKIHRLEFDREIGDCTRGCFHVLTLVEGDRVSVRAEKHPARDIVLNLTESVIIPASTGKYSLVNVGQVPCKVIKSLLK